jgi:hypothetical protein
MDPPGRVFGQEVHTSDIQRCSQRTLKPGGLEAREANSLDQTTHRSREFQNPISYS